MLDAEIIEKYFQAGKVLAMALKRATEKVKPGIKLLDLTKFVEDECIRNKGYSLAFPLNIGINGITAHYACPINDESVLPSEGIVKLDAGVQVEGYTTDMAVTIQFGTEKYQTLIDAAEAGLATAIKRIHAGVTVHEVGIAVEKTITSYGVQPIHNLSGHMMTRYQLHAGVSVPSISVKDENADYKFKEGDIFALEPFTTPTSAAGYVKNGKNAYIFSLIKRKVKNMPAQVTRLINRIWGERRSLPFSFRWYSQLLQTTLNRLMNQNILRGYPVLIEASGHPVAQAEKTILVQRKECEIITP
ncbi:MAG: type II methionyl aminopeptidase [Candidatus Helarchaeota archaeon]